MSLEVLYWCHRFGFSNKAIDGKLSGGMRQDLAVIFPAPRLYYHQVFCPTAIPV